ncbi:MAG: hypothetical protein MMC33_005248 [Icmadophila ericetorum]|nr:hypothetical protein [Icmadophila ericetorum]
MASSSTAASNALTADILAAQIAALGAFRQRRFQWKEQKQLAIRYASLALGIPNPNNHGKPKTLYSIAHELRIRSYQLQNWIHKEAEIIAMQPAKRVRRRRPNQDGYTARERRVLITKWLAEAWDLLFRHHSTLIADTFQRVGLTLDPSGDEDTTIRIDGFPHLTIGDYTEERDRWIAAGDENFIADDGPGFAINEGVYLFTYEVEVKEEPDEDVEMEDAEETMAGEKMEEEEEEEEEEDPRSNDQVHLRHQSLGLLIGPFFGD